MLLRILIIQAQLVLELLAIVPADEAEALQQYGQAIHEALAAEVALHPTRRRFLLDVPDTPWTFETWSNDTFAYHTRFHPEDFETILPLLGLPPFFILENRSKVESRQALAMFLCRMAEPARLGKAVAAFGWEITRCSRVFHAVLDFLYVHFARALLTWCPELLSGTFLDECAAASVAAGCPLNNVVGFIDGTNRAIARPTVDQQAAYSGHKRHHCLTYQGVICTNGILVNLFCAAGARSDMGVFALSGIADTLPRILHGSDGRDMALYGDLGYGNIGNHIYTGFRPAQTEAQAVYNAEMSSFRIAIEHGFGLINSSWRRLDYTREQKLGGRHVAREYFVAAFLTNVLTCLRPNQVSRQFEHPPPRVDVDIPIMMREAERIAHFDLEEELAEA